MHITPDTAQCRCDACPYSKNKMPNRPVLAVGLRFLERVKGVIIGDHPSSDDVNAGAPLAGIAGQELEPIMEKAGLFRRELVIMNAIACRPNEPKEEADLYRAVECCRPYVGAVMRAVRNNAPAGDNTPILMMGKFAYMSATGKEKYIDERGFVQRHLSPSTIEALVRRVQQDADTRHEHAGTQGGESVVGDEDESEGDG